MSAAWKILVKGCYYHFTQAGWRFVQNNNMASSYLNDSDDDFKLFVKCVLALPHVPLNDVQETIHLLDEKEWEFEEDEAKAAFKKKFLEYIQQYWIDGQVPPQVWNCFSRKVDLTNNNNESHNNYLNSALKETHPSPANFTVAIVKELTLAETKWRQVKSGKERKVKKTYQKMNRKRTNLKKMYSSLDRIEYLAKMGNIVRHIHLNKGQMAEMAKKKVSKEVDGRQEVVDGDSEYESESDAEQRPAAAQDDSEGRTDSSNLAESLVYNARSSNDESHEFEDRVIGKVHN